jgi:hypothetical protein
VAAAGEELVKSIRWARAKNSATKNESPHYSIKKGKADTKNTGKTATNNT